VYVTHDQREAMSMADKIAIMNQGVIEQLGAPQEIYERPVSVFVADFMGSPAMNFIPFEAGLERGATSATIGDVRVGLPALRESVAPSALLYGVRPEHVNLRSDSAFRGEVLGTEYLGTSQIVSLSSAQGHLLRAKIDVNIQVQRGDHVGLVFDAAQVSLFDKFSGLAIPTARDDIAVSLLGSRGARRG
jgi:multiple sugar transport system ATP-binding protein